MSTVAGQAKADGSTNNPLTRDEGRQGPPPYLVSAYTAAGGSAGLFLLTLLGIGFHIFGPTKPWVPVLLVLVGGLACVLLFVAFGAVFIHKMCRWEFALRQRQVDESGARTASRVDTMAEVLRAEMRQLADAMLAEIRQIAQDLQEDRRLRGKALEVRIDTAIKEAYVQGGLDVILPRSEAPTINGNGTHRRVRGVPRPSDPT